MAWWKRGPKVRKLCAVVERHLGVGIADAQSVTHDIKAIDRVNIQRVADRWAAESAPPAQEMGYSTTGYMGDDSLVRYLVTDELIQAPAERIRLESGVGASLDCVQRGLLLAHVRGRPIALGFRPARYTSDMPVLELIAADRGTAADTLSALLAEAKRDSCYKGHTLALEATGTFRDGFAIRFQQLRHTPREQIVLPEELLRVVERNVLGMVAHGAALKAAKRSLRRGLLFHGLPGTGKSMLVRHLASACKDHTIILLTGSEQGLLREGCQVARLLAPSIVVLEDVDLIAEDRERNRCPSLLHDLLNEMDGLTDRDEVTFLLTTNRPEALEPALANRPGRIDQAIAFPLPDAEARRRLFAVYGEGTDLSGVDLPRWVVHTEGVSPAFIEELLRKTVLLAAERGEGTTPIRLRDEDVDGALRELVQFGGELTQKILGYRPARIGYQPAAR